LLDIFHWAKILLSNNNFNWTPCRDSCSNILFFSLAFSGADLYFTLPQTNSFLKNSECDPEFMYESGYDPTWATARSPGPHRTADYGKKYLADESASHALSGCHYARLPEH
jgi:hypothetical protein